MARAPRYRDRGVEDAFTVIELLTDLDDVKIGGVIRIADGNVRVLKIARREPKEGGICVRVEMASAT